VQISIYGNIKDSDYAISRTHIEINAPSRVACRLRNDGDGGHRISASKRPGAMLRGFHHRP
ncbi:MAG: hypothetical protein WCI84_11380, partial [Bacteroidota bacterium]